ncbi:MAG TPA: hypothetical protein VFI48_11695, partial [Hyphomicrobiaceae bacterium]|nr:hypothetical protein [Hyphomicrobiaceae bacterium]
MAFLAKILGGLFGSQAATITIPVLALAALVFAHQWKQNYDGRLYAQATNVCDTRWKAAVRQQERDAARHEVTAARA